MNAATKSASARPERPSASRRAFLRAAGATLSVPWFIRRAFANTETPLPRLVLLMQTNGTQQANFWPKGSDLSSPILDVLFADPALRERAIVIKGLFNADKGAGNGHDLGFSGLYSGYAPTGSSKSDARGGGISIDQFLKQKLDLEAPIPTVHCGALTARYRKINDNRLSFSYSGPRTQVPCEGDPYKLYARFFGANVPGAMVDEAAARRRLLRRQSVLDSVAGDLSDLAGRLGGDQRRKLDLHLSALRDFEKRLETTSSASCAGGGPAQTAVPFEGDEHTPAVTKLMFDFITLALTCNMSRIATFQFGKGGEHFKYPWLDIDQSLDTHDHIAHRDSGDNAVAARHTVVINQWYAEQVRSLALRFKAVDEGGVSALDNSLIVWGNELAAGTHLLRGIPVVLLGRAAGRIKRTGYLLDEGPQDYHRLGCSLLNVMGVPSTGFGEAPSCGVLKGLTV